MHGVASAAGTMRVSRGGANEEEVLEMELVRSLPFVKEEASVAMEQLHSRPLVKEASVARMEQLRPLPLVKEEASVARME
jgi:hypothetical protein